MKVFKSALLPLFLLGWISIGFCQENIPLGTWRLHLSYNRLIDLEVNANQVFAASENGVLIFDQADGQIATLSKSNGLSSSHVTAIGYAPQQNILLVAHEDGLLDILKDNTVSTFTRLATTSAISESKKINAIHVEGTTAYLSADFGVVVFDLKKLEVKETYRDLGENGGALKIFKLIVYQDSLFLATENGILSGPLAGSNLLDFRSWNRYDQGELAGPIKSITEFNNSIFAAIDAQGIYALSNGVWIKQPFLQSANFNQLEGSTNHLLIAAADKAWAYDGTNLINIDTSSPANELAEQNGTFWIASEADGLLSNVSGNVNSFKPNGPSSNNSWRLKFDGQNLINVKGGYSNAGAALMRTAKNDRFINGQWAAMPTQLSLDITDYAKIGETIYFSSFGQGLEKQEGNEVTVFTDGNSPLTDSGSSEILIPSMAVSSEGLWVANYNSPTSLHLLKGGSEWESFSISPTQAQYPLELLVDIVGQVWMRIDPAQGGGIVVFDKASAKSVYLTSQAGKGGLPTNAVLSITNDREGQVWVGTEEGVAYFPNPKNVFNSSVDAVRPIFDNRFLLRDESITALAVDGGNRKWIGTTNGIWLFDALGEKLIANFTVDNSPLLSNGINSVAIDSKNGEVFMATDNGVSSFRSDASGSQSQFVDVKIFPNPVSAQFNGLIAINGLYTDAIVKITDIAGRLVWQTRANGGTASWNARQLNGDRVGTGMYLVFATSEDGAERHVGKIAIIE